SPLNERLFDRLRAALEQDRHAVVVGLLTLVGVGARDVVEGWVLCVPETNLKAPQSATSRRCLSLLVGDLQAAVALAVTARRDLPVLGLVQLRVAPGLSIL